MVFLRKNLRSYNLEREKFESKNPGETDSRMARITKKAEPWKEIDRNFKVKGRRVCRSFDNLDRIEDEENANGEVNGADNGTAVKKPGFIRRIFLKRYKNLQRSKSDENIPTEALNISMKDTADQRLRDRSRTVPSELWDESTEKGKRRGAVSEDDDEKKEEFTKILQTFMVRKHMDDYGF